MFETTNQTKICQLSREIRKHNGAFYVGLLDGLLGVAGIMKLVMKWIIPENSPVSQQTGRNHGIRSIHGTCGTCALSFLPQSCEM